MAPVRRGRRLGVDVGDVRVGVAVSDDRGSIATPVATVQGGEASLPQLAALAREHEVVEVVVGLPKSLSGAEGPAATKVRAYAVRLALQVHPVPVRLVDERMTTRSAERMLRETGRKGTKRRAVVDQAAAVEILQTALDTERISGTAPGETLAVRTT